MVEENTSKLAGGRVHKLRYADVYSRATKESDGDARTGNEIASDIIQKIAG